MRTFAQKQRPTQQNASTGSSAYGRAFSANSHPVRSILHLQRTIGNHAVQRLLQPGSEEFAAGSATRASTPTAHAVGRIALRPKPHAEIQHSLTIGAPGDIYEQEADRVAQHVLRMPTPKLAGPCASAEECPKCRFEQATVEGTAVQEKGDSDNTSDAAPQLYSSLDTLHGRPLPDSERAFFEPRFGFDFSAVRIHTDSTAAQISKTLGAKAFTRGSDIYFGAGMYDTNSTNSKRLVAHELTHVVQQTGGQGQRREEPQCKIAQAPEGTIQRAIQDVQQAELATFLSQPERLLPQPLLDKYLVDPALMATQRSIIRALVDRVQRGEAPLTVKQLQTLVSGQESDLGTALLICHNVTKALARGTSPINWSNLSRDPDPLVYSLNGATYTFDPSTFHRDAIQFGSRAQESVFYAMLSINEFGQRDEGDWYHYYAMATTSYYKASGGLQTDSLSQSDLSIQITGELVRRVAGALRDPAVTNSRAYEGWLMANATSFLEGGYYGQSQDEVNAESDIHIQGASGGVAAVDRIPEENWQWYVPRADSISNGDLANFHFRHDMVASIRAGIDGEFELTIISGTTPSQWYDRPDPFVKLPGFFSSRTTVKVDTSTPVWNESLTTLHHDRLAAVTVQLYDADPVANDHIADFTDDLRPEGQRSRNFSLTAGSSTLEVRVEATGNVVLATP